MSSVSDAYPRRLLITAYHEAGHAAAAWWLHFPVRQASIVATEDHLGRVITFAQRLEERIEYDDSPAVVAKIESHIQICYAGPLAQRRKFPRSKWRRSASVDFRVAAALFSHISGSDEKSQYHHSSLLRRRAELLVEWLQPEIEKLAAELLIAKSLKWSEIRRILLAARLEAARRTWKSPGR